jgi:hypothetical protein
MKNLTKFIVPIVLGLMLAGCWSKKDAGKGNFENVINKYLERNPITISPLRTDFPVTIELPAKDSIGLEAEQENINQYEALAGIGFLEVKSESVEIQSNFFHEEKTTVPAKIYSLTEKGKQALDQKNKRGFCVATYEVDEISDFSEPSETMGYTISHVNYTVSPHNIVDWVKDERVVEAFPLLKELLEKHQSQSATLVLMNDGWIHAEDMDKSEFP